MSKNVATKLKRLFEQMNTAEKITKNMNGEWFRVLVSKKYQFNRDVQAAEESELREAGFDWEERWQND